jgi:hypothetical protein
MDHQDKTEKDKKVDETIKITSVLIKGLYEKDRAILESPAVTDFVEKNFGVMGKQYYDKMKESYLR